MTTLDASADATTNDATADGGDGGSDVVPQAVLCPETDPFHPKLPNSVTVQGVTMTEDATWTKDKIYLIGDDFKVENHKLTVEAGTTICLFQTGRIFVGEGIDPGEIHLNGTAAEPITITTTPSASDPTKPDVFHQGIHFDTYLGSSVSYTNIWYGGPGGGSASWAFELSDTAHGTPDAKAPLKLDHVVVGGVQSKGIRIATPLGVADGSSIRFTGYAPFDASGPALDAPLEVEISAIKSMKAALNMMGATIPDGAKHINLRIQSSEGQIGTDTDVYDLGLPFLWRNQQIMQIVGPQNDPVGAAITFHEGVQMQMSGAFIVGATSGTAQGNLIVAGTADKPVIFTSTEATPAKGDWEGFYFVGGQYDTSKTKIDHAQILYAGVPTSDPLQVNHHIGHCGGFNAGAVMIAGSSTTAAYAGPTITNTKIAHSASDGIVSDSSVSGGHVSTSYAGADITFEDIAGANTNVAQCL